VEDRENLQPHLLLERNLSHRGPRVNLDVLDDSEESRTPMTSPTQSCSSMPVGYRSPRRRRLQASR